MHAVDTTLPQSEITHEIIGAYYNVYNTLGFGFVESVYANAMQLATEKRGLVVEREKPFKVEFSGVTVGVFRADLVVGEKVIVEIKVAEHISAAHERQTLNYLRASGLSVGLILNFGPKVETRRMYWSGDRVRVEDERG